MSSTTSEQADAAIASTLEVTATVAPEAEAATEPTSTVVVDPKPSANGDAQHPPGAGAAEAAEAAEATEAATTALSENGDGNGSGHTSNKAVDMASTEISQVHIPLVEVTVQHSNHSNLPGAGSASASGLKVSGGIVAGAASTSTISLEVATAASVDAGAASPAAASAPVAAAVGSDAGVGAAGAAAAPKDIPESASGSNEKGATTNPRMIDETHKNYVLMYDMLTGIRVAVSRCEAKENQQLNEKDYSAEHKLAFDITGNEMTPSSKYDFKFKDYAPWVFRHLRAFFKIDTADYLVSLTGKYVLSELGSPGKSGSFFYFSQDYRYIIKTISHTEHNFLRKILKDYYLHVKKNPNTLLARFFGLHRVKLPRGRKIHFVVMGNILPPNKDIHEVYDLKGSTQGRQISEEEIASNPRAVMKDNNWLARGRKLILGPEKRRIFFEQLEKDAAFLKACNIMDYSLLLGVHYKSRGNAENIRDRSLALFEKNPLLTKRGSAVLAVRQALAQSDPVALGPSASRLLNEVPLERRICVFYADEGGFGSTDELNQAWNEIYFIGIIDILTPYNAVKRIEHAYKSINHDEHAISSVHPSEYCTRFLEFLRKSVSTAGAYSIPPSTQGEAPASGTRSGSVAANPSSLSARPSPSAATIGSTPGPSTDTAEVVTNAAEANA